MPRGSTQISISFCHRLSSTSFNAEIGLQAARGTSGTPAQTHVREQQLQGAGNTLEDTGDRWKQTLLGTPLERGLEGGAPCRGWAHLRDPHWGRDNPEGPQRAHAGAETAVRDGGWLGTHARQQHPEGNTWRKQRTGRPGRRLTEVDPGEGRRMGFP